MRHLFTKTGWYTVKRRSMQESINIFEDLVCYFWMTQQIATSTIWTYVNVIQHKSLSCPYLKITRALKNKRTLLLLYTSSWHTNIYEWSVKFVYLLLPAVSLYKEHAKCNKKLKKPDCNAIHIIAKLKNWKELSRVIYQ